MGFVGNPLMNKCAEAVLPLGSTLTRGPDRLVLSRSSTAQYGILP